MEDKLKEKFSESKCLKKKIEEIEAKTTKMSSDHMNFITAKCQMKKEHDERNDEIANELSSLKNEHKSAASELNQKKS